MTKRSVDRTDDRRHVVVDGRRWRATDPSIPDTLRAELVAELMGARREIGRLQRVDVDGREAAVAAARRRVHDAKVALGERGAPWWEQASADDLNLRIDATARALLRHRDGSICPSDVARVVASGRDGGWRAAMDMVRARGVALAADAVITVTRGGEQVDPARSRGPVRWQRGDAFDAVR